MMTPIHVLCPNFTKIGFHEVGETTRILVTQKFIKSVLRPFGGGHQKFAVERATWVDVSL